MLDRSLSTTLLAASICACLISTAVAETTYVVRPGDSLSSIAEQVYGNRSQWTVIYDANIDKLIDAPAELEIGLELRVPTVQGDDTQAVETTNVRAADATLSQVRLLARSSFGQLVDRDEPDGGPLATYVIAAFRQAGYAATLEFTDQAVDAVELQATFPHLRNKRDEASHFVSEPVGTYSLSPFWLSSAGHQIGSPTDLRGYTVCGLPNVMSQLSHSMDKGTAGEIVMVPDNLSNCFRKMASRTIDIVLARQGEGLEILEQLGIAENIEVGSWKIEIGSLHVLVPRFSPYGSAMIYRLNEALKKAPPPSEITAIAGPSPAGQLLSKPLGSGGPKSSSGENRAPIKRTPTM